MFNDTEEREPTQNYPQENVSGICCKVKVGGRRNASDAE